MMRSVVSVGLVLFCTAAFAQEPPKPGSEHERLKDLVGTWDATMIFGDQKAKGTMTYKLTCGGLWLTSEYEGDFGGQKFEGRGLDGYDPATKKYVGVWVDSMIAAPLNFTGTVDPKTKDLVMTAEGMQDGKPAKFKTVTSMKGKDEAVFKMYMVDGDNESLGLTIEYKRKK